MNKILIAYINLEFLTHFLSIIILDMIDALRRYRLYLAENKFKQNMEIV